MNQYRQFIILFKTTVRGDHREYLTDFMDCSLGRSRLLAKIQQHIITRHN